MIISESYTTELDRVASVEENGLSALDDGQQIDKHTLAHDALVLAVFFVVTRFCLEKIMLCMKNSLP